MWPTPALTAAATALRCCPSRRPGVCTASVLMSSRRSAPLKALASEAGSSKSAWRTSTPLRGEIGEFFRIAGRGDHLAGIGFDKQFDDAPAEMAAGAGDEKVGSL